MPSLGELFISLGFDVDDTKLKSFKSGLEDTKEAMAKVAEVAFAGIGALSLFVQQSADKAVGLNNMAIMFGANADAAQEFGNALHVLNTRISASQGMGIFGKFSEVVKGLVPLGAQQGNAISILGGYQGENSFLGTSAQAVIAHLAENYANAKARFGSAYSSKLSQAGLDPGVELLIKRLSENPEFLKSFQEDNMTAEQIAALKGFSQSSARLEIALTKFDNDVSALAAGPLGKILDELTKVIHIWDKLLTQSPDRMEKPIHVRRMSDGEKANAKSSIWESIKHPSHWFDGFSIKHIDNSSPSSISGSWDKLAPNDRAAAMYWISHVEDAKLDPKAFNPAGGGNGAKGIGQWRADRQTFFQKLTGHDLLKGTLQEQQDFLAYELMTTHKNALTKMDQESTLQGKTNAFGRYFEQGDHGPITINVHSNATDNREVAHLVVHHLQAERNAANAQTNTGGW
jgi:tail lysozyme